MTLGTVAILGPGLIGGSVALALAERGLADRLVIYARRDGSFPEIARKLPQAVLTTDATEAVRGADVVVLCVPIETMGGLVKQFAPGLKPTALVTDVGSVKASVDRELAPLLAGRALWIGSHPMAGSEKSGFAAARADLFVGARVILTHTQESSAETKRRAEEFWQGLGGNVFYAAPFEHDRMVAQISHLPHLAAAALVNVTREDFFRAAGTGFRDTTRVASGPPDLWAEIVWDNREKIAEALAALGAGLEEIQASLREKDKTRLHNLLRNAHDQRAKLLKPSP